MSLKKFWTEKLIYKNPKVEDECGAAKACIEKKMETNKRK